MWIWKNVACQSCCYSSCGVREHGVVYNFECVCDYADSHKLLAVVAAIHHQGICEAFDDGALGLAESLDSISAG